MPYSAVVLDSASHVKLIHWLGVKFPPLNKDWEFIAPHMTIAMGGLPASMIRDLGSIQELEVNGFGFNNQVIAVRVSGYFTTNKNPHVTIAVNRANGGKPVMSNAIANWHDMAPFKISGTVQELK